MKKIFVLLFSIWIPIYVVMGLLASCESAALEDEVVVKKTHDLQMVEDEKPNAEVEVNASFHYSGISYLY